MKNDNILGVNPVEKYSPPKYPAYTDTGKNPALLKKLPSRWQRNAKVLACIGLMSTIALSGCDEILPGAGGSGSFAVPTQVIATEPLPSTTAYPTAYPQTPTVSIPSTTNADVSFNVHHGGAGGVGYVVYLTEQEALYIMSREARALGFNFVDKPPAYRVTVQRNQHVGFGMHEKRDMEIGIMLYDKEKNAAITLVNVGEFASVSGIEETARQAAELLAELRPDITFGVLVSRGQSAPADWNTVPEGWQWRDEPTGEMKLESRGLLEQNLAEQVRAFLDTLA